MVPCFTLWAHSGSVGLYPQSYRPFFWRVVYICRWVGVSAHFPPEKIQKSDSVLLRSCFCLFQSKLKVFLLLQHSQTSYPSPPSVMGSRTLDKVLHKSFLEKLHLSIPGFCWDGSMCHPANQFIQRQSSHALELLSRVLGAGEHSTRDKGHEEGGSAYAKAGSSLRSPPGYSRASTPQKPESAYFIALCSHLWLYWGLSPTTISLSLTKS